MIVFFLNRMNVFNFIEKYLDVHGVFRPEKYRQTINTIRVFHAMARRIVCVHAKLDLAEIRLFLLRFLHFVLPK